jgi:hypothetical protein
MCQLFPKLQGVHWELFFSFAFLIGSISFLSWRTRAKILMFVGTLMKENSLLTILFTLEGRKEAKLISFRIIIEMH